MVVPERPPLYTRKSKRFTVCPSLFVRYLIALILEEEEIEPTIIDLNTDDMKELAKDQQQQIEEANKRAKNGN